MRRIGRVTSLFDVALVIRARNPTLPLHRSKRNGRRPIGPPLMLTLQLHVITRLFPCACALSLSSTNLNTSTTRRPTVQLADGVAIVSTSHPREKRSSASTAPHANVSAETSALSLLGALLFDSRTPARGRSPTRARPSSSAALVDCMLPRAVALTSDWSSRRCSRRACIEQSRKRRTTRSNHPRHSHPLRIDATCARHG